MNDDAQLPRDAAARAAALDPGQSFLVQAPAGSGKTQLLIQRYLRLLAIVRDPEEILAVTFTRKAAAEMRDRVMQALTSARAGTPPAETHRLADHELAMAAIRRDAERGWNLLAQPGRLRITTIDTVNRWLSGRSPLTAGGLSQLEVADDARTLYRDAARETVTLASDDTALGAQVRLLLERFDNRAELLAAALAEMLGRRDQWLRHTGPGGVDDSARETLESAIADIIEQHLRAADAAIPAALRGEIVALLDYAAGNPGGQYQDEDCLAWRGSVDFPAPDAGELSRWRGLASMLQTQKQQWRSSVDVRSGFPPNTNEKTRMLSLLERLAGIDGLRQAIAPLRDLPDPHYTDSQWQALKALLNVLPVSVGILSDSFRRHGQTDFNQVASDALRNLRSDDTPTELSLVMDYRLSHLLLDEYQDTSRSQYDLLLSLTAGWEPGDGRSLFLVGDPMQSIYRFREAEVGVYLKTRVEGLNELPLGFLQLETNFRSDPLLVKWANATFSRLLPEREDPDSGAVAHAPSVAFRPADAGHAEVAWHVFAYGDRDGESRWVAELVDDTVHRFPDAHTVGVLVRSRRHAARLGGLLSRKGIEYSAPDLELLGEHAIVQDLLSLTRALTHAADRTAWLALLRSPFCGLTLSDLHALAGEDRDAGLWTLVRDERNRASLSDDGRKRVERLVRELAPWVAKRGRCHLRDLVEGAWLQLGGPAAMQDAADFHLADEYFACLAEHDRAGDCADIPALIDALYERPVTRASADARVQVMTMHKAKGLEFDTVILPGLGYPAKKDQRPALLWQELAAADRPSLLLAPLHARGEDTDPVYELLWRSEQQQAELEAGRLLYVAATRARLQLHLCAALDQDKAGNPAPRPGSLLRTLWPAIEDQRDWAGELAAAQERWVRSDGPVWREIHLRRLPSGWQPPVALGTTQPSPAEGEDIEFEWASPWARHVGSVVHRWLQEIATVGAERFDARRLTAARPVIRAMLQRLGTPAEHLSRAEQRVLDSLANCLDDVDGCWLLSAQHREARNEYAVTVIDDGSYRQQRIDRSFVTGNGERWIVDYKTGTHEGTDLEGFLASEAERYRPQLRNYRDAMNRIEPRLTRTALYYPLLRRLLEVDVDTF